MVFFMQHSGVGLGVFGVPAAVANPLAMLKAMESGSPSLAQALANGKPTVIDFYADWCENCRAMAPVMSSLEKAYGEKINFVVVDGDSEVNYPLVDAFRVDGIPHLAMVTKRGEVETALVGVVPQKVVEDDIKALIADSKLPYAGFDAFAGREHRIEWADGIKIE
ncbi:unnamed protein product [Chrysoparadoxa australica]